MLTKTNICSVQNYLKREHWSSALWKWKTKCRRCPSWKKFCGRSWMIVLSRFRFLLLSCFHSLRIVCFIPFT